MCSVKNFEKLHIEREYSNFNPNFYIGFFDKEIYFEVLKENGVFEESGWKRTLTRANKNDIFAGYYVKYKNTMNNN